jgi:hypothetical protein
MAKLTIAKAGLSNDVAGLFQLYEEQSANNKVIFNRLAELLAGKVDAKFPTMPPVDKLPKDAEKAKSATLIVVMSSEMKIKMDAVREDWKDLYAGKDTGYNMFFSRLENRIGFRRQPKQNRGVPVKVVKPADVINGPNPGLKDVLDQFFFGHESTMKAVVELEDEKFEEFMAIIEAQWLEFNKPAKPARRRA